MKTEKERDVGSKKFSFIVIEGIDGVGKSTCAELLTNRMDAVLYKTPPKIFEKIRKKIENFGDKQVRFNFYLASVIYASNEIRKLVLHHPVICDRYIYSTIAYHKGMKVNLSYINIKQIPIISPDFSFYLYARENIRKQRINSRKGGISSVSDIAIEKDIQLQRRVHKEFLKLPVTPIDASDLTAEGVCDQIYRQILKK
jgi:dTMP kinase